MLGAVDEQGVYIIPSLLTRKEINDLRKRPFYCPECKNEVIVRAGPTVIPHFAHKREVHCPSGSRGGEGMLHYQAKIMLYNWLRYLRYDPQLEKFLPKINQRPDLYVKINRKNVVFEYQRASITHEEINARNEGFKRANMYAIWILGENHLRKLSPYVYRIPSFTKEILQPHFSNYPSSLIFFSPQQQRLITLSDIHFVNHSKILARPSTKSLQEATLKDIFVKHTFSEALLHTLWLSEKKRFRLANTRVRGREYHFRNWLYEQNLHVEQLPSFIHLPIRLQYKMNIPLWHWQTYLVLKVIDPTPIQQTFSLQQCMRVLHPYVKENDTKEIQQVICEYLVYFERVNLIKRVSVKHWKKINNIQFYRYIEEAIRGDNLLVKRLQKENSE